MKKSKKKKKPSNQKDVRNEETPIRQDEDDESKPFDYGGLPDRDLKKNLGCGG